jgi:hypothetical protein
LLTGQWISHVGTVYERDGNLEIAESTTLNTEPCSVTKKCIKGVQSHPLVERIASYQGRVWISRLSQWHAVDSSALTQRVLEQIGKPYDEIGCLVCGTGILKYLWNFTPHAEFCSELRLLLVGWPERNWCGRISPAELARAEQMFSPLVAWETNGIPISH